MLHRTISIVLLTGIHAALLPAGAGAAKSGDAAAIGPAAGNTHFMLFNLPPAGSYDV